MNDASSIRDILDFWFLPLDDPAHGARRDVWWQSTPAFDTEIAGRFGPLVEIAVAGGLASWRASPDGALALILLCDQFPRNMFRRTAQAFAGDAEAIATARVAIARLYPSVFGPQHRMFFYLPFQHSEQIADQELACALFDTIGTEEAVKYAVAHRDIVARFGRFPHRNDALGRTCTPEELVYLETAERFGQ